MPKLPQHIEERFDKQFPELSVIDGVGESGGVNGCDAIPYVKSFIATILEEEKERVIEDCKRMKKWDGPDRSKSPMFTYKDVTRPYNRGFNDALSDVITKLSELKK